MQTYYLLTVGSKISDAFNGVALAKAISDNQELRACNEEISLAGITSPDDIKTWNG